MYNKIVVINSILVLHNWYRVIAVIASIAVRMMITNESGRHTHVFSFVIKL